MPTNHFYALRDHRVIADLHAPAHIARSGVPSSCRRQVHAPHPAPATRLQFRESNSTVEGAVGAKHGA
jgi:hypothetical protein